MKKIAALLIAGLLAFSVACAQPNSNLSESIQQSGSGSSEGLEKDEGISILTDKTFSKGLRLRGLGGAIYKDKANEETYKNDSLTDVVAEFEYGQTLATTPEWKLAQWSTRYSFNDSQHTSFVDYGDGIYEYINTTKRVKIDTNTGAFELGLDGSKCYVYGDRTAGQEWPHLLIERDIDINAENPTLTKISDKDKVVVTLDAKLNYFKDHLGENADPGLHSAMMMVYLYVANYDEVHKCFTDMLWFGVMIFDNRWAYIPQMDFGDVNSKDSATGKYIYNLPSDAFLSDDNNFWENGQIVQGEDAKWVHTEIDVLPYVDVALKRAKMNGYMRTAKYENLYVNGMYIGYELPGTYDIDMSFRNLDIKVYEK